MKKTLVAGFAVAALSTGIFAVSNEANAQVTSQNGIILHDDSKLLEHELQYVDVLVDPNANPQTKERLQTYFKNLGLNSVSEIIQKAKQDGLDTSKYDHLI
ncbi:SPIN family peroxidase inhibitor [Staphylococcus delphini]|uniref:SPIN family peroxidase inhibitor n=1 Tax=Staphylococcus delphini TaxID=53344 RepID=UPI000BBCBAF3|nr:SPIN family peroxidase inhibitor [Staphylococcus delphini]MDE9753096.1 SPIN family peroxidase inhibitor [Staphylococcus delphini]MDE9790176.1 SPIN family peroxidase inhibitor [Staphylococcus delphini]MDE9792359.1 SPIN family peroxidase inhibitor [Staphylococcus delphini]MDE9795018.1 SPIN family peroxidase inhibitor [Staphylococcus delphini]MDE9797213.1 SPIN family peroxidase inhibitor [Staphylococcus delphini]